MKKSLRYGTTGVGVLILGFAGVRSTIGQPVYSDPPCPEGSGSQNPPSYCNLYTSGGFVNTQSATCYNGCESVTVPQDECCSAGPASCGALVDCGNIKMPRPMFKATKVVGECIDGKCVHFGSPIEIGSLIAVDRYENGEMCDCGRSPTGCAYE